MMYAVVETQKYPSRKRVNFQKTSIVVFTAPWRNYTLFWLDCKKKLMNVIEEKIILFSQNLVSKERLKKSSW